MKIPTYWSLATWHQQSRFQQWLADYKSRHVDYATCRFLGAERTIAAGIAFDKCLTSTDFNQISICLGRNFEPALSFVS